MRSLDRDTLALAKLLTVAASIEADNRISELHAKIDERRRIIEELAIQGNDHGSAMIVLESLQLSLSLYLKERLRLRAKLTDSEEASAASGPHSFIAISRSNQRAEMQGNIKFHFKPVPRETALK